MLLKFFKRPLPSVFASIFAVAFLLWLQPFITGQSFSFYFEEVKMPLYAVIANLSGNFYIQKTIAFIGILLCALYLIQLNSRHILIKYRTYLPALFFILLSTSFMPLQTLNPAIFATFFLVVAINHLFLIYDDRNPLDSIFKAGLYVSIASLFYLPAMFYFLLVIISIFILNAFNFRNIIVALVGFLTPWFFFVAYLYLNDNLEIAIQTLRLSWFSHQEEKGFGLFFAILSSFGGLLFLISLIFLLRSLPTQKISTRKFYSIFLWFAFITGVISIFVPFCSVEIIYIAVVPVSFVLSNYFTFSRNRFWPELLFTSLFAIAVLMQFF